MKAPSIIVAVAAIASALSGCSGSIAADEAPCKTFESAYNRVAPGSGANSSTHDYGVALKGLVDDIEADARNGALTEVRRQMLAVVWGEARYRLSQLPNNTIGATPQGARENVKETIAGVANACKDSGFPISLRADNSAP